MHRARTRLALFMIAIAIAAFGIGCRPSEPLRVTTLQLGRSLNSDNSVGIHTTQFKPGDSIYVSIHSLEPGYGTLTVRWFFGSQMVSEANREVSYQREAATEFHLQNSGGFPPGDYSVEILINGEPAGRRQFRVEQ